MSLLAVLDCCYVFAILKSVRGVSLAAATAKRQIEAK